MLSGCTLTSPGHKDCVGTRDCQQAFDTSFICTIDGECVSSFDTSCSSAQMCVENNFAEGFICNLEQSRCEPVSDQLCDCDIDCADISGDAVCLDIGFCGEGASLGRCPDEV